MHVLARLILGRCLTLTGRAFSLQKVLDLYKESLTGLKKLVGHTSVLKDIRYGPAARNVLDVGS